MKTHLSDGEIEHFAKRAALGNNGGDWAVHYTEDQKEHWRAFVRDLVSSVRYALTETKQP